MNSDADTLEAVRSLGNPEKTFPISMGPRFLELFSENLYSSPNKAFEELVANSWDADATAVYVSIPDDLRDPRAAIWVLDNGVSMDADGLETLWQITSDHKRKLQTTKRPQIGKFGIGKLATYILASEITFICKAGDGLIRTVPFNYREIEESDGIWDPDSLPLTVRVISENDLQEILSTVDGGDQILELLSRGVPHIQTEYYADEFHHPEPPAITPSETWTLALLTSLRDAGTAVQRGRIRFMLRSALPLTSDLSIILNNEVLEPTKIDSEKDSIWILGEDLAIDEIELEDVDSTTDKDSVPVVAIAENDYPYITIEGIDGRISGQVTLYKSRISGGKSENIGASNGFFVNVLGRVINLEHADFGLENLSHGAWAHFRATIRADGLDPFLGVERDGLRESRQVRIFKRFLMATFNKARTALNASRTAEWPKAGDVLDGSWKSIPMKPLAEIVSERLASNRGLPGSIHGQELSDLSEIQEQWNEIVETNPGNLIAAVRSEDFGVQLPFSRYELKTREVQVNESHPYFAERNGTIEERRVMQDFALADFLTELYLIGNDVDSVALDEGRAFRDEFLRLLAQLRRRTGPQIIQMLMESTSHPKALEVIVGDALDYMGFNISRLGASGEPEGIARAPLTPNTDPYKGSYSFSYDAKSTNQASGRVSNQHVRPGTLARHRKKHNANYTLVVAPDFESGALQDECKASKVTPMRATDLAELLMLSAKSGTVDFVEFRTLFELFDPTEVQRWVEEFVNHSSEKPHIPAGTLLQSFEEIGIEDPDELETTVIARHIRLQSGDNSFPSESDVRRAIEGLGVFLPSIVRNSNKQVYLSASPKDIRDALLTQLQMLPESIRLSIDPEF